MKYIWLSLSLNILFSLSNQLIKCFSININCVYLFDFVLEQILDHTMPSQNHFAFELIWDHKYLNLLADAIRVFDLDDIFLVIECLLKDCCHLLSNILVVCMVIAAAEHSELILVKNHRVLPLKFVSIENRVKWLFASHI